MKVGVACSYERNNEAVRSRAYNNKLLDLLKYSKPESTEVRVGNGSLGNPYRPTTISEWYWLAQQDTTWVPTYILAGGRILARWGAGAEALQDYVTDVTGYEPGCEEYCVDKQSYRHWVQTMKEQYDIFDHQDKIDIDLSSYSRKALRLNKLDDAAAAQMTRDILAGADTCGGFPELACTLVSLFVSESYRSAEQAVFPITLMLLDLVQTRTTYGTGGAKTYTWKSMLMHHAEDSDKSFAIEGRNPNKKPTLAKHPMAGVGTAAMGRGLFSWTSSNESRDRVISIMAVWNAHYLQKKYPKAPPNYYEYFIIDDSAGNPGLQLPDKKNKAQTKADEVLELACRAALRERNTTLACLIGGTTVGYVDKDWHRV